MGHRAGQIRVVAQSRTSDMCADRLAELDQPLRLGASPVGGGFGEFELFGEDVGLLRGPSDGLARDTEVIATRALCSSRRSGVVR